jgi:hypothetical protein
MAEREGFEPSVRCNPYDGLANRYIRPLCHLSDSDNHEAITTVKLVKT